MDNLETVRIFDAGNELLEEAAGLMFWHATIGHDVVEKLSTCVLEDNDDVGWC